MTAVARADIERFRGVVARRFGLAYDDGKLDFLADVVRQRMDATGCARFDTYLERVDAPQELGALADVLTVAETFFFRNADQFRAVAEVALPERIRARATERRLRILSAGCASGEEPYSLAVTVREALPEIASWDVQIRAIDLNPAILAKAALARYSTWSLRATSEAMKRRYFRAEGRDLVLDPAITRMVTFEQRNLADDDSLFWRSAAYDIVFFRNVLMYFTPDVMAKAVGRVTEALVPGGYLFLGHAETLRGLTQDYHLRHTHETFYYQRRDGGEPPPEPIALSERTREPIAPVDISASWVDTIQRASERIASLDDARATPIAATDEVTPAARRALDLGLVLEVMKQERFTDALELLSALLPESPDADALLLHAVLLTNNGKLAEAEDVCARLLRCDELNAGAHYLAALCREHAGDAAGAVEHDQTAIYLDAVFAMPHLHLGLAARRAGDQTTAQRELAQALILLAREDASRLLLFGGGFSREMLIQLCRTELQAAGRRA